MLPVHVLLVEDDPISVFNTKRFLNRAVEVRRISVACDGRDAVDRLRAGAFVGERLVVLTDLRMPRMSGLELLAAIRAEPSLRDLPVVVLTASNDNADRLAALTLEAAAYFVKVSAGLHLEKTLAWLRDYCTTLESNDAV